MAYPSPETIFGYFLFFLPGITTFFVYRFLSDKDLGSLERLDFLLIIFFTFVNKALTQFNVSNGTLSYEKLLNTFLTKFQFLNYIPESLAYTFLLILASLTIGFSSDITYRLIVGNQYKYENLLSFFSINDIDTNDTPIWVTKLREEWWESSKDFKNSKKLEVTLENEETAGYLTGFSETDLELTQIEYDSENKELIYTEEWFSKDNIVKIHFLDETVGDNYRFNEGSNQSLKKYFIVTTSKIQSYLKNLPVRMCNKLEENNKAS